MHDWFNAKAATLLVEASQARVSRFEITMDNHEDASAWNGTRPEQVDIAHGGVDRPNGEFQDDEDALHDLETPFNGDAEDDEIMETIATQTQTVPQHRDADAAHENGHDADGGEDDEGLHEVEDTAPPVFRTMRLPFEERLGDTVKRRLRKNHVPILEEQPKWALLAKVLKEIEDTIARAQQTHADAPGTNIVLVMCASDRTCLQLRQYLTTMVKTDPPFGPQAGRKMMETLFLSNWRYERVGRNGVVPEAVVPEVPGSRDEVGLKGDMETAKAESSRRGRPSYKRRRLRGGAAAVARLASESDLCVRHSRNRHRLSRADLIGKLCSRLSLRSAVITQLRLLEREPPSNSPL